MTSVSSDFLIISILSQEVNSIYLVTQMSKGLITCPNSCGEEDRDSAWTKHRITYEVCKEEIPGTKQTKDGG